jgi:hypothetical protein
MLAKLLDHGARGRNESLRFAEDNYPQSALMRNSEPSRGVPGRLVIDDGSAAGIGKGVSQHGSLAIAQTERRHVGRNRPRIDGNQPDRLGQRLNRRVGRSFALYFQDGCLRYHHGRPQSPQQVKLPHPGQQDNRRRIDDPECNQGGSPP